MRRIFEEEKKEQKNVLSRIKDGLTKKIAPIVLAGSVLLGVSATLTGCLEAEGQSVGNQKVEETKNPYKQEETSEEYTGPRDIFTPADPADLPPTEEEYMPRWNAWLEKLNTFNFVADSPINGHSYKFNGDFVEVTNKYGEVYYYDYKQEEPRRYAYESNKDQWVVYDGDVESIDRFGVCWIPNSIKITKYDRTTQEYTGYDKLGFYYVIIFDDELNAQMYDKENDCTYKFYGYGKVDISLPDVSETICKQLDAQMTLSFNCARIGQVIEDWAKGNNQYGKDVQAFIDEFGYGQDLHSKTLKVLWVEATNKNVTAVELIERNSKLYIEKYTFRDNEFYSNLNAGNIRTEDDLRNYLMTHKDLLHVAEYRDDIEYTSLDEDYATKKALAHEYGPTQQRFEEAFGPLTQKEVFDAVTEKLFDRIENEGTQSYYDTPVPNSTMEGFKDARVLFSFKTEYGNEGPGGGLGIARGWDQVYIIERNGDLQMVIFGIESSTYNNSSLNNPLTNVLLTDEKDACAKNWLLTRVNVYDLDDTNLDLWEENNKTIEKSRER